jgi:putative PIN family toxin of toxin-antitoxin system
VRLRAVIDTSVFISTLLASRGVGVWLLTLWQNRAFDVVMTENLYAELHSVLSREHIATKIAPEKQRALLRRLRQDALWFPGEFDATGILPDPGDDILMSAAMEANAAYIVTWDAALIGEYRGVQIIDPDVFVSILIRQE